jgi:hypothetical protein
MVGYTPQRIKLTPGEHAVRLVSFIWDSSVAGANHEGPASHSPRDRRVSLAQVRDRTLRGAAARTDSFTSVADVPVRGDSTIPAPRQVICSRLFNSRKHRFSIDEQLRCALLRLRVSHIKAAQPQAEPSIVWAIPWCPPAPWLLLLRARNRIRYSGHVRGRSPQSAHVLPDS